MQVELLCNGGYTGTAACIGKQFDAECAGNGAVNIAVWQLEMAGFINDGSLTDTMYFFAAEVRVID